MTFQELQLNPELLEGIEAMGFEEATPIQEQAIPLILENRDILATAQTGSGKTAAFLLPILNKLIQQEKKGSVNTLILVPTRELAKQIDQMIQGFAYFTSVSSLALYGGIDGASFVQQKKALTEGTDVIISTPGILISHLNMSYAKFDQLEHFVLDEADKMLDMGFHKDIIRISSYLSKERQTIFFSATMPGRIKKLTQEILKDPARVNIALSKPAEGITQIAYLLFEAQKAALVKHIMKVHQEFKSVIIFSSRKSAVKSLMQELRSSGFSVKDIHSDLKQTEREDIIREFRNRSFRILIGTDVIARGLDIDGIDVVINFEVPKNAEDYVHRIGRTARHASTGLGFAFTFIESKEQQKFYAIERELEIQVTRFEIPEYLGEAPKPSEPRTRSFNKSSRKKPFRKKRSQSK